MVSFALTVSALYRTIIRPECSHGLIICLAIRMLKIITHNSLKFSESGISKINSVKVRAVDLLLRRYAVGAVLCKHCTVHCVHCQPANCLV